MIWKILWEKNTGFLNRNYKNEIFMAYKKLFKKYIFFKIGIMKMKYFWVTKNNFKKNYEFLNMNYSNEIFLSYKKQLLQKKRFSLIWIIKLKYFCLTKNNFFLNVDTLYLIGIIKQIFFINKKQSFIGLI